MPHESTGLSGVLARLTLRQGHAYVVHSDKDFADLVRLVPDAHIRKTALPTYEVLASGQLSQEEAKRALSLNGKVLLFFGFVREYKGLKYLLDALPKVLEAIKVHLLIVGEFWEDATPYLSSIEELQISDYVTIVDRYIPNEEIGRYFFATDLVVLPYADATQSAVIQLAFGFNKPVITTDVGGLAEVVSHGKTGFIVPPRDSEALADSIIKYFEDGLAPSFQRNIEQSRVRFGWEKLVEVIEMMSGDCSEPCSFGPTTS